ncbi:MAG: hypothetical protein K2W96_07155 [Gemmataceae bacterium]|nr:hypothetical protein [Gemmataceae bacterium]
MGQFDQTARQAAKLDPAAFHGWALSRCVPSPGLAFVRWDDTRRLVAPGEPDRENDLVSEVRDEARPKRPAWLITEIEDAPEPGICWRTGIYEALLGK